jgi:bifunctional non-homologous end joining protein LigD
MLLTESAPFDSEDHIYELKLDGIRALAYLDGNGTELRNKRNKRLNDIYPELGSLHTLARDRCILDGELVLLSQGKPDFFELQRRSLMSNTLRISISSRQKPVQFVAFDILYFGQSQKTELPLLDRKALLQDAVREELPLAVSRYIEHKGVEFFNLAAAEDLEGVVAKRKDSRYVFGKRSRDWVKFKKKLDADLVICGYVPGDDGGIKALALGAYKEGRLVWQGNVAFGLSGAAREIILRHAMDHTLACPFNPPVNAPDTKWCAPELVCAVQFMMRTQGGFMRQPVFKGLVQDKRPEDCVLRE